MSRRQSRAADRAPHGHVDALAAERVVVGALFSDPDRTLAAVDLLALDAAAFPRFGPILEAARRLRGRGEPCDVVTVLAELRAAEVLESLGGTTSVLELAEALPAGGPDAVVFYARRLKEAHLEQRIGVLGPDVHGSPEVAAELERALEELRLVREGAAGRQSVLAGWPSGDVGLYASPPLPRPWLLTSPGGQGVLPLGKAAILAAEGGTGKTSALVALAVSVVTGRLWLGHYEVPDYVAGRALLLLAEEDGDDVHRRLWSVAEAYGLSEHERARCAAKIVAVPLAGLPVALTTVTNGVLAETPLVADLRQRLSAAGGGMGWSLVGIDPLSRFAGGDVEGSNEAATRFVEVLESLTRAPGHPTVLVCAHSSKTARRQGQADVRGVTGLTDAARWVATLQRDRERVVFSVVKSNYSLPTDPVPLRWEAGVLRTLTPSENAERASVEEAKATAEVEADIARVVDVLRREGAMSTRDAIAHAAGLRLARGRAALDLAIARKLVLQSGTARQPKYVAVDEAVGVGVCVADPPYTPRTAGTASRAVGQTPSDLSGTATGRRGTAGRREIEGEYSSPEEPF